MFDKASYIAQYRALHKRDTGEDITDALALEHFEKLISLVHAIYKPIPKERFLALKNKGRI